MRKKKDVYLYMYLCPYTNYLKQTEIDNGYKIYNHTSIQLQNPLSSRESNIF